MVTCGRTRLACFITLSTPPHLFWTHCDCLLLLFWRLNLASTRGIGSWFLGNEGLGSGLLMTLPMILKICKIFELADQKLRQNGKFMPLVLRGERFGRESAKQNGRIRED